MVEGKTASRVPTCVGKVAGSNPAIQTIFSDNRMTDASAYVYVLRSVNDGWYYVGCSVDPQRRLVEHNSGESKSTRARRPYELAYTERFPNLSVARKREQEIKRKKSRQYIDWLIAGQIVPTCNAARPDMRREDRPDRCRDRPKGFFKMVEGRRLFQSNL